MHHDFSCAAQRWIWVEAFDVVQLDVSCRGNNRSVIVLDINGEERQSGDDSTGWTFHQNIEVFILF